MEEYLPTNVNVMYDALTIERNYLLMKIFFIGGPTERDLPPRILCQVIHKKINFSYVFGILLYLDNNSVKFMLN